MSHVFGSNTSTSSWEAFRQEIQNLITVLSQRSDQIEKHKEFLNAMRWIKRYCNRPDLLQAFPCKINSGVFDSHGNVIPMTANIYIDDILAAGALCDNMIILLTAIIKAIFLVCRTSDIMVRQCHLSLKKWFELIVGPRQIILGIIVNTNKMMVGITNEYIECVWDLMKLWDPDQRFSKVNDIQKLIGKLACLGEGAPWIFKLVYSSSCPFFIRPWHSHYKATRSCWRRALAASKILAIKSPQRIFWVSSLIIKATSSLQWRWLQKWSPDTITTTV